MGEARAPNRLEPANPENWFGITAPLSEAPPEQQWNTILTPSPGAPEATGMHPTVSRVSHYRSAPSSFTQTFSLSVDLKEPSDGERTLYGNQLELILSLVSYTVGLGNLWRFPHLAYENGGGSFLLPYVVALMTIGVPLFLLELGLGQVLRQGTVNVWVRLGMPRLRGAGVVATWVTFLVTLYYMVIMAWSVFFIWSILSHVMEETLPWEDNYRGFTCNVNVIVNESWLSTNHMNSADLFNTSTDLFHPHYRDAFVCPATGIPTNKTHLSDFAGNLTMLTMHPMRCPGEAALAFWNEKALERSSGITELGGLNYHLLACHTVVWICIFFSVFKGIAISGKIAIWTGILPCFCLICLFFRAVLLENAEAGLFWYLTPDLSKLQERVVWQRASSQIFFSLGVGWGSIVAFGSYADPHTDYIGHVTKVVLINSGTSIFAGFVVFSILGFLAGELSEVNPCFDRDDISKLESIGLHGSGLAFVAFPIAVSQMEWKFTWAFIFFVMLFALGIGTGFGFLENLVMVLQDSRFMRRWQRWKVAGVVCLVSYLLGLIFVTRAGDYWLTLFDSYVGAVAVFVVCLNECVGMMWMSPDTYTNFCAKTEAMTGRRLPPIMGLLWKYVCPTYMLAMLGLVFGSFDLTGYAGSGEEPFPDRILWLGWSVALIPVLAGASTLFFEAPKLERRPEESLSTIDIVEPRRRGGTGTPRHMQAPRVEEAHQAWIPRLG